MLDCSYSHVRNKWAYSLKSHNGLFNKLYPNIRLILCISSITKGLFQRNLNRAIVPSSEQSNQITYNFTSLKGTPRVDYNR